MTDFRAWASTLPSGVGRVHIDPGPVAWIRVDDASTRNALDPHMMVALADAADAVRGARVVILTGEHGTFCSGGNLGAVRDHLAVPGAGATFGAFMRGAVDRLTALDAIVIAAVDGAALGGGAEFVAAADLVVAAPSARIGFVHARLGVSPGFGGGAHLVRRVGPSAALRLLAFAKVLPAVEAHALGLVDELADNPRARAAELAAELLAIPDASLRGAKRLVRAAAPAGRDEELAIFAELWGGPAHRKALEPRR
jgi:enoyl-CoA hydratase/carnithine racemase